MESLAETINLYSESMKTIAESSSSHSIQSSSNDDLHLGLGFSEHMKQMNQMTLYTI